MVLISLIIFLSINQIINSIVYNPQPDERGPIAWNAGVNCIQNYAERYFINDKNLTRTQNILLTYMWNLTSPANEIQLKYIKDKNDNMTNLNYNGKRYQLRIISDQYEPDGINKIETALTTTDYYVIVTDNIKNFNNIFLKYIKNSSTWNPGAKFIILYNNIYIRNQSQQIGIDIFQYLHKYSAVNVTLLYAINISSYDILLLNNYYPGACRQIHIDKYGYCIDNGVIIENNNNYYKQFNHINLENCTYNLCSRLAAPFVENNCTNGIEINLILQMQEHLKFQLNSICENEERGILENGTWSHLLGKLIDKTCDFIIGGFYPDNEVQNYFWVTDPYLNDIHTWYIKLAEKLEPWKGLVMIFKIKTWEAFSIILFISWLIWYIIGNLLPENNVHKSISLTAINTLAVILGSSVNTQPKLQTLRLFFMALTLYGLNITCLYTSQLILVFSHPRYEHQVSTLIEVINLGIPYGGPEENKDWFVDGDDKYIADKYKTTPNFESDIQNLHLVQKGAQVMLLNRKFVLQSTENQYLYPFPKAVFTSPLQIITKKGFPLLYEFNNIIRRFHETGLFEKINDDFEFNNTILKNIRTPTEYQEDQIVLTTHHLSGAFAVLIVGWIIAILGLIFELLAKYFIIPWLNEFFGLKIGQKTAFRTKILRNSQNRKDDNLEINNELQNYIFRKNKEEFVRIRFTPVERRRIIMKGKDLRKFQ